MTPRPLPNTLESLRATLQKLEQTSDPDHDEASLAELKRVVLNRIADLELSQVLEPVAEEGAEPPRPDELVPPASGTETEPTSTPAESTDLSKLD